MSSLLTNFTALLQEHGVSLLIGTTVLLLAFAIVVHYSRSLSKKYMAASTAMLALLGYLVIAIVPMPRFGNHDAAPTTDPSLPAVSDSEHLFAGAVGVPVVPVAEQSKPERAKEIEALLTILEPPPEGEQAADAAAGPAMLWIGGLLAAGIALFTVHLLLGLWRLRKILATSRAAPAELTHLIQLPERTQVRIATEKVQPFCCGLLRPTIVLPKRLAQPSDEARFVLLHERAHLTSGDTRARMLCALLRPVMFWHPLYWWLQQKLRFTSELLADDAAAQGSVAEYVRCMMTLSTHPDPAAGGALVATIFRRRSELFRRLEMMLQRNEAISRSHSPMSRWTRAIATLALIGVCAGTFGVEQAVAQSPDQQGPGRSDAIKKQVKELRAELARLRHEIAELNATTNSGSAPAVRAGTPYGGFPSATAGSGQNPLTTTVGRAPAGRTHTVKAGDTLAKIAKRYYGSSRRTAQIRRLNPDMDPRRLRVGEKLRIDSIRTGGLAAPVVSDGFPAVVRAGQNPGAQPRRRAPRATSTAQPEPSPFVAPTARRRTGRVALQLPPDQPGATAAEPPMPTGVARPADPWTSRAGATSGQNPRPSGRRRTSRSTTLRAPATATTPEEPSQPAIGPGPTAPRRTRRRTTSVGSGVGLPGFPSAGGAAGGPSTGGSAIGGPAGPSRSGPSVAIGGPVAPRSARAGQGGAVAPSTTRRGRRSRASGLSLPSGAPAADKPGPAGVTLPAGVTVPSGVRVPPGPVAPRGAPDAEPPGPTAPSSGRRRTSRRGNTPMAGAAAPAPKAVLPMGTTADLITRCIELRGDVEIQEVHVKHARSKKEQEIAKIRLRTKKEQYQALRSMLKAELQAAELELARSRKLREAGFISESELQATESKIHMLSRALR